MDLVKKQRHCAPTARARAKVYGSVLALCAVACDVATLDAVRLPANGPLAPPDADTPVAPPSNPLPVSRGYLHTDGVRIVDANGDPVQLVGISWFGLETGNFSLHGLWTRSLDSFLDQIAALGFNTLRIPFSNQLFEPESTPNSIDLEQNPGLAGLNGLGILDALVAEAELRGLRIILDRHHPDANSPTALWYSDRYDEARWISDWVMLATHYADNATVIGFELHDSPHDPATWGDASPTTDWRAAAERAGNAVLAANPDLLILVQGIETVGTTRTYWGGNLSAAVTAPVNLAVPARLLYSAHDFSASVSNQDWFNAADYPANLPAVWDEHWGYLARDGVAPVLLSAFGSRLETESDRQWFEAVTDYLQQRELPFAYWCLNPNSGDTGGLLLDDWQTVDAEKLEGLEGLLAQP